MISLSDPSRIDPHILKVIKEQLILLLHANVCTKRDRENYQAAINGQPARHPRCDLPSCGLFKYTLSHLNMCTNGSHCLIDYCNTSKQLIKHWRECQNRACAICAPLRRLQTFGGS
ncbi:histone acetyltransferase [Caenorhabditis elegans]|uniref:histone acetyltransferase n=1 Tax=Caenorhabditis elegans TaxID=6239 RepID=O17681_CAEEL|nr:histone acetyltransferase [Caenorhabditis elegans]CAB03976.2 histone acetyltransferase [Caenorhabditis elegans]